MKYNFKPTGCCSKEIQLDISEDKIVSCNFVGGCKGNATGLSRLVEGMKTTEVIEKLKGTLCQANTSCPDQLALALEQYNSESK